MTDSPAKFRPMYVEITFHHDQIVAIAAELRKAPDLLTPADVKRYIADLVQRQRI